MKGANVWLTVLRGHKQFISRLLIGSMICHPAITTADETQLIKKLDQLQNKYANACQKTSILERIQLARTPDRRKMKARDCSVGMWSGRASTLINEHYDNSFEDDQVFRERIGKLDTGFIFLRDSDQVESLRSVEFATKKGTSDDRENKPSVEFETLHRYTTLKK